MNIYRKKRQRPTVPIISLIDILAILLIFFIVTTTFKTKESLVNVTLPKSSELGEEQSVEKRVALALGKDGGISLGSKSVPIESLATALREHTKENPGDLLELKADEGAPLGLMVKVWDAAAEAGLEIGDLPLKLLLSE